MFKESGRINKSTVKVLITMLMGTTMWAIGSMTSEPAKKFSLCHLVIDTRSCNLETLVHTALYHLTYRIMSLLIYMNNSKTNSKMVDEMEKVPIVL